MLFLLITIVTGCMSDDVEEDDDEDLIEDGRYCAQINYYNPSTQTCRSDVSPADLKYLTI